MRRALVIAPLLWACLAVGLNAQASRPAPRTDPAPDAAPAGSLDPLFAVGATEVMITAGPAHGVQIFHSSAGHNYLLQALSWGRVLTAPHGPGALRGRFQWSLEVVPIFRQYDPDRTFGVGVTPLHWRWNFLPHGPIAPFAELAGGLLFTRDPVPENTTGVNFTAHTGAGIRWFLRPAQALVLGYRFHHISNGNRLERNPGVNAHVLQVGWTFMRPPRRRARR